MPKISEIKDKYSNEISKLSGFLKRFTFKLRKLSIQFADPNIDPDHFVSLIEQRNGLNAAIMILKKAKNVYNSRLSGVSKRIEEINSVIDNLNIKMNFENWKRLNDDNTVPDDFGIVSNQNDNDIIDELENNKLYIQEIKALEGKSTIQQQVVVEPIVIETLQKSLKKGKRPRTRYHNRRRKNRRAVHKNRKK